MTVKVSRSKMNIKCANMPNFVIPTILCVIGTVTDYSSTSGEDLFIGLMP